MSKKLSKAFSQNKFLILLILLGSLSWSLVMIKSGPSPFKGFWGPNGHDGIWHLSLANSLAHFPWQMPNYAGAPVRNYHIAFDLMLITIHKLSQIPLTILYFQILPPVFAVLTGFLTYKFVILWKKSYKEALWATFFVYFSGSFGWLITLFRDKNISGESIFWSQQSISTLINPPFALSLLILLLGFICLIKKNTLFTILLFGILIQIKSYAGVLVLGGLLITGFYQIIFQKKLFFLKIFIGALLISLLVYLPLNRHSSSLLIFKPFWFLETMMQVSDRFYWPRFGEAMVNYKYAGNFIKAIPAYGIAFIIFNVGNFGMRVLGLKYFFKKHFDSIDIFIISIIGAGIIIPTLFVQSGTPWNTIQFFYFSLFLLSILTGIAISHFSFLMLFIITLLTIPTTLSTLHYVYLPKNPPSYLSKRESEALNFLSKQNYGVVLTYLFDEEKSKSAQAPKPLYFYVSTAYVSAFSQKPVFFEDEMNADITGLNWRLRKAEIENFYKSLDQNYVRNFLKENKIRYIYWVKPQRAALGETQLGLTRIFENSEVDIYEVK